MSCGTVQLCCHNTTCRINFTCVYKLVPIYLNFSDREVKKQKDKQNGISSTFQQQALIIIIYFFKTAPKF